MSDIAGNPIVQAIESGLATVASAAETLDPGIAPFVVLGQAAAAAIPGIIDDVVNLIGGTTASGSATPSPADVQALANKIQGLSNPAGE